MLCHNDVPNICLKAIMSWSGAVRRDVKHVVVRQDPNSIVRQGLEFDPWLKHPLCTGDALSNAQYTDAQLDRSNRRKVVASHSWCHCASIEWLMGFTSVYPWADPVVAPTPTSASQKWMWRAAEGRKPVALGCSLDYYYMAITQQHTHLHV